MGFAIAQAAAEKGHQVTLVAGPVSLPTPSGVTRVDVVTACEMLEVLKEHLPTHEVLIMSAAVADWRPQKTVTSKLKKHAMSASLELEPNPDILKTLKPMKGDRTFVGFAAETGDPLAEAERKLEAK